MHIRLVDLAGTTGLMGSELGRSVFDRLRTILLENPHQRVFALSADAVTRVDATFARESVLALAKQNRGLKVFCLIDISDQDHLDNWDYAADNQGQPLTSWNGDEPYILGAQLTSIRRKIVDFVLERSVVSTTDVAEQFGISISNASTTLKYLLDQGYIHRTEKKAVTGGVEYFYRSIRLAA
jgi:DNA-binding transcriptional ArsR family regulator